MESVSASRGFPLSDTERPEGESPVGETQLLQALAFNLKHCHLRKRTVYDFQLRRNHGNNSDLSRNTRIVLKNRHTRKHTGMFTFLHTTVELSFVVLFVLATKLCVADT